MNESTTQPDGVTTASPTRPGPGAWLCIQFVRLYQVTLSRVMGGHCRFHPTCSHYAIQALQRHGAMRGCWLTLRRLARCHPLGGFGYDPVPPRKGR